MGGWACYSYQNNGQCTPQNGCPNNSGAEGEQFYVAVNNSGGSLPTGYVLTGIQQCNGAEGVGDQHSIDPDTPSESGQQAIEAHMKQWCITH